MKPWKEQEQERLLRTIDDVARLSRRHSKDHSSDVRSEILKLYRFLIDLQKKAK